MIDGLDKACRSVPLNTTATAKAVQTRSRTQPQQIRQRATHNGQPNILSSGTLNETANFANLVSKPAETTPKLSQQEPQQQPQPQPQQQPPPQPQKQPQQQPQQQQADEEAVPPPQPTTTGHDVMISYNLGHQETALKVRDYFRSKGNLTVWIDVEQMSGDMNTKMAQAIVKSKVIVMCLSAKYQTSANCRKEYEYADKKSKKFIPLKVQDDYEPEDGTSLDLILGQQLYYCIEKEEDFDKNMPKVVDIILHHLKRKH